MGSSKTCLGVPRDFEQGKALWDFLQGMNGTNVFAKGAVVFRSKSQANADVADVEQVKDAPGSQSLDDGDDPEDGKQDDGDGQVGAFGGGSSQSVFLFFKLIPPTASIATNKMCSSISKTPMLPTVLSNTMGPM